MSADGPVATADPSTGGSGTGSLVAHLEVCRLQAELERLEGRLADLRVNHATDPGRGLLGGEPRVTDDADEVIDRMVATLLESGRSDIAASSAARQHAAEERLRLDRTRAAAIVGSARADLDRALTERGEALHEGWDAAFDVIVPADREDPPAVVADPSALAGPPAGATPLELPAPVEVLDAPEPARPGAAEVEAARTDAAFEAWMAVAPGAAVVDESDLSDERATPVGPSSAVVPAPTAPETDTETETDIGTQTSGPGSRARSRWLLPLEVIGALLAAAVLVVLALVLIG